MAYVLPAAFREPSLEWYTRGGYTLTDSEAETGELTAAIAAMSSLIDYETYDHYEAETAATLTLDVTGYPTQLYLPKRVRTVTSVKTVAADGAETTEVVGTYRVHSSLNAAGTDMQDGGMLDWIEVLTGFSTGRYFPQGTGTVKVTGNFSWTAVPELIKRAVAVLVYDHFKPAGDQLRTAQQWTSAEVAVNRSLTTPTGLPEVDRIIEQYNRGAALVAV